MESIQYTFNWWRWGIISNPRFSQSLDDIALIQLSLSIHNHFTTLVSNLGELVKVAVLLQSSFSAGGEGTHLTTNKWVDGVGLM